MNLIYRGKKILAFKNLFDSCDSKGTAAMRLRPNHPSDDYRVLQLLLKQKLVELKNSGPRGGSRYHVTQAGKDALEQAQIEVTHSQCAKLNPHFTAIQTQEYVYAEKLGRVFFYGDYDKNKKNHVENMKACA